MTKRRFWERMAVRFRRLPKLRALWESHVSVPRPTRSKKSPTTSLLKRPRWTLVGPAAECELFRLVAGDAGRTRGGNLETWLDLVAVDPLCSVERTTAAVVVGNELFNVEACTIDDVVEASARVCERFGSSQVALTADDIYVRVAERGLSVSEFAKQAGLVRSSVVRYLAGKTTLRPDNRARLAKLLELETDELPARLKAEKAPRSSR